MVHGCGNKLVKFVFFSANLLICLFGALTFGFSLWANLDKNFAAHLEKFSEDIKHPDLNILAKYQASLWVLVAVGALLFLVGFLGCCGAVCENNVLLSLFFVVVLILTVIEFAATIFAVSSKTDFQLSLRKLLDETAGKEEYKKNLKPIQDLLKCCGATPESHSREEYECSSDGTAKDDCYTVITNLIESRGEIVTVTAFILLVIEVVVLISTCILCRAFRERSPYFYA